MGDIINYLQVLWQNRIIFVKEITVYLKKSSVEKGKKLWSSWLKQYWDNRNNNILGQITNNEFSEMLNWLLYLQDFYSDAVKCVVKTKYISKVSISNFIYIFVKENLLNKF